MTHKEFIGDYLQYNTWYIKNDILYVNDVLWLDGSAITKLPDNLCIEKGLDLLYSNITELPNSLKVTTWLDIGNTKITKIPDNLKLEGDLYIENTEINFLPKNLHIGDSLYNNDKITRLPNDLVVKGVIHSNIKLEMIEQMQMKLIKQDKQNFKIIKDPTEKAIALHKLIWEI